ncbi:MAG: sigma 54-interacting transcriptional regulator [Planctomycetota bacterium]|nr:sigma 54-interacting transcriptional regulator [Planctomycetota bacterium]
MSGLNSDELDAIYRIVSQTSKETGEQFFCSLVKEMSRVLGVSHSFVSVFTDSPTRLKMLAYWNGTDVQTNFEYDLESTPSESLLEKNYIHYPRGVREHYPKDKFLEQVGAESFRGVPLIGQTGVHFGYMGVIDVKECSNEPRFVTLLQTFALRAVAEIDRLTVDQARQRIERRLASILESAMDAIVVVDQIGRIQIFNQAAERIFRIAAGKVLGTSVYQFFTEKLAQEMRDCEPKAAKELERIGCFWLPEGLSALRADGEVFPVEATLSRVQDVEQTLLTIILRDISERLGAMEHIEQLCREKESLEAEIKEASGTYLIGQSEAMKEIKRLIELVSRTDSSVLILGETGTGKELVARSIHLRSDRYKNELVCVNCASLPESLIEAELFGHEKGAFTGAVKMRRGRFERADGGTIFLDEIGELPLTLQSKLLRVLQDGEFERVGGSHSLKTNVRVLAATNRDLEAMVNAGMFREDLYYRLNVIPIKLPPLRERLDDLPHLIRHFERQISAQMGQRSKSLSDADLARMRAYSWPGNVRELQNILERGVLLSQDEELNLAVALSFGTVPESDPPTFSLQNIERRHIKKVLKLAQGRISGIGGAAELLEINPSTLRSKLKKLGIHIER